jgi:HEXXH motif-containing protein
MTMTVLAPTEVASDIEALATFTRTGRSDDLVSMYGQSLNAVQRYPIRFARNQTSPTLSFDLADARTSAIVDSLMRAEDMAGAPDISEIPGIERKHVESGVVAGLALLRDASAEAAQVVRDLVAEIVVVDSHGLAGGSFWQTLGMIWISPVPRWTASQYAETLLHEGTHQAMFLHDMVNGLFAGSEERLASAEALITSPIRKVPRPYDASFHAAVVSATLIDYFESTGDLATARAMLGPLLQSLTELSDRNAFLSDAGQIILDRVVASVNSSEAFRAERSAVLV